MKKLSYSLLICGVITVFAGCSRTNGTPTINRDALTVDLGADVATLDPQMSEDSQSHRVILDLFEGLTTTDQKNQVIPGLAESWTISEDQKTYVFNLRPNIKFSNGKPITANDVVFSYQRLVSPKVASPYNHLLTNVVNANDIIAGKKPLDTLGVKALNKTTIEITLDHPDASFLDIVSLWNLDIVSKENVTKFGNAWTSPKNIVTSGAYKLDERVVKGYILESKNPYYYDESHVTIKRIKFMPNEDNNSSLNQYKSGDLDITYSLPIDQYKTIKNAFGNQLHTVTLEGIYYYDLNMMSPLFKNNLKLRKALSMAVDRGVLVRDILGQGQVPLYSYATNTVEDGKYSGLDYDWAKTPRSNQLAEAKELFAEAGYSESNPLVITISYNNNDLHKKVSLAIGAMWQRVFGFKSVRIDLKNQEWKTFLQTRHTGNYDIARDAWIADYNSVDSYTTIFKCNGPQNNSHYCNPRYDELLQLATAESDLKEKYRLNREALKVAMNDYPIIPLYQYTYFRLINPKITNYTPAVNHLDHVQSKWYSIK